VLEKLPEWAQWALFAAMSIVGVLQTYFLLFVLWPSVVRGRRLSKKFDDLLDPETVEGLKSALNPKKAAAKLIDKL